MSLKDKPLKKCHTDKRKMIDDLHTEIIQTIKEDKLNEYYLDNGLLLDQYYSSDKQFIKNDNKDGILSYFNQKEETIRENNNESLLNKKSLINEYMCNIDDKIKNIKYGNLNYDKCELCNSQMLLSEIISELICSECGNTKEIMIVTEKNSYSDPPREISYFAYKRINHFNEWLAQFQAKEKTELPNEIYNDIYKELNKNIYYNPNNLKYKDIREILKRLKYNKYYEHIPHIISVICGKKAPTLDRKTEETLRSLFKEIQIPFMNNCPSSRKNFLSYSYVLHKFCELLEFDHLLEYFPLLKSREKLHQQDLIWQKICKDLKWQYIPSL
tara:strand:+ start:437 stop:1420 length:984 start_codon:yes stop_codon:yes gene_type:complete